MGACQSGDVEDTGVWNDAPDYNEDADHRRNTFNK